MDATSDNREELDRLLLLLISRPRQGFECEFEDLCRREVGRLAAPARSDATSSDEIGMRP
jgi:hypothetical protein